MDISIVILNYKNKGLVLNCVKSIKEADWTLPLSVKPHPSPLLIKEKGLKAKRQLKYEIIVIDNNSGDSIGEILNWQYPDVKFIQNGKNLGMGAGNNAGIRRAAGEYIVIANPDIMVFKDTFRALYGFMERNKKAGAAGPMQFNPDRTVQHSCYRWHSLFTPLYRRTPLGRFKFARRDLDRFLMRDIFLTSSTKPHPSPLLGKEKEYIEVDWLLGSLLFCRSKALKEAGLFDPRFFLYFEDTDLCRRFWRKGWKVVYFPEAKVIHNHARKSAEEPWYKFFISPTARAHIVSWIKYLRKWGIKSGNNHASLLHKN